MCLQVGSQNGLRPSRARPSRASALARFTLTDHAKCLLRFCSTRPVPPPCTQVCVLTMALSKLCGHLRGFDTPINIPHGGVLRKYLSGYLHRCYTGAADNFIVVTPETALPINHADCGSAKRRPQPHLRRAVPHRLMLFSWSWQSLPRRRSRATSAWRGSRLQNSTCGSLISTSGVVR